MYTRLKDKQIAPESKTLVTKHIPFTHPRRMSRTTHLQHRPASKLSLK